MPKGNIVFMLHAHLPFAHHPQYDFFLEENWLFEAITETYIPLLRMFKRLEEESKKFNLTMSITPPLMEMLANEDLQRKYILRIEKLIELAEKEVNRTQKENPKKHKMAKFYLEDFKEICDHYSVPLIEDAAESLGATYRGKQTGTFGKYSALSLVDLKNRTRCQVSYLAPPLTRLIFSLKRNICYHLVPKAA